MKLGTSLVLLDESSMAEAALRHAVELLELPPRQGEPGPRSEREDV